jgi:mRNA interferase MazF
MNEGDVILVPIPQADGVVKNRPALILREMPPFRDMLVCGISTQIHQAVPDFDEVITSNDDDFHFSGLVADSVVRLGFLAVFPRSKIVGSIGHVAPKRHDRLLANLSAYLTKNLSRTPNESTGIESQ